jgi:formate-dependent nitrite reductase membrane component NrfD
MSSRASKTPRDGSMVPEAEFTSYYGLPILNAPVWHTPQIPGYFFLGGLAGASSGLAAGAQLTGRPELATRTKVVAAGAIGLSAIALVRDLGRPERFYNMLRVFKPTSPMSVGSWLLAVYGPAAGVAAMTSVTRRLPRIGMLATAVAAGVGPAISTYTAALLADTAVPAWHEARRELPVVFAGSSALAAGGMGLVVAPSGQAGAARRLAIIGAALEMISLTKMQQRLGSVGQPYAEGRAGGYMKAARALVAGGLVLATLGRRKRSVRACAGVALLSASACTRFGIFGAGRQSAADPKYTVEPQRASRNGKGA